MNKESNAIVWATDKVVRGQALTYAEVQRLHDLAIKYFRGARTAEAAAAIALNRIMENRRLHHGTGY